MSKVQCVGLDVHAETITVAVAELDGEVRSMGTIPNRLESIRKLIHKLGPVEHLRACYEAGPTGYVLYWQLTQLGGCLPGNRAEFDSPPRQEIGSRRTAATQRNWLAVIELES